jgi:hypothetical protein
VSRGGPGGGPITPLVARLEGQALFGQPLEALDATTLNRHARRLRVSVIVALDEDLPRLAALADNPDFAVRRREPPFVIWSGSTAALPRPLGPGRWRVTLDPPVAGWAATGVAYYPLWRAAAAAPLETRRGPFGDLEVRAPSGPDTAELSYTPGVPEITGVATSTLALVVWIPLAWRRRPGGA